MPPHPRMALAQQVFDSLGFLSQPTSFDAIVTDEAMKQSLASVYKASDVSRLLRHMPDLLLLHKSAEPTSAALFVKLLSDSEDLSIEADLVLRRRFPKEIALW